MRNRAACLPLLVRQSSETPPTYHSRLHHASQSSRNQCAGELKVLHGISDMVTQLFNNGVSNATPVNCRNPPQGRSPLIGHIGPSEML